MDDEYPNELLFPGRDFPGVMRLSTASALLAFEDELDGLPFVESESEKLAESRPHAFHKVTLSGNLQRRAETFLKALCDSVQRSELKPVSVRRSLEGTADPARTWILVDDLHDWCGARDVHLGDWFNQYIEDEQDIFMAAGEAADRARRRLEDPELEERLQERARAFAESMSHDAGAALALLRENESLRAIVQRKKPKEERPLGERERTTLLNIVAGLLQYTSDKETAIIDAMLMRHPGVPGLTKRTLEAKFAEAKRSLTSR